MDATTADTLGLLPNPTNFVQIPVELIRRIGPNPAILLGRMHFRFGVGWRLLHERAGKHWWEATLDDLAAETGLTVKQVRGALDALIAADIVVREKHRIGGKADHSYSYRIRTADEARALLSTDLPQRADQSATDLPQRADLDLPQRADLLSYETLRTHNTDSVGEDDFDPNVGMKSGPFRLTPARTKLITDAMIATGQSHHLAAYLSHLEMQTWATADREIKTWCGIAAAMANGQNNRRDELNELLASAGMPVITEADWQAMLRGPTIHTVQPQHHCAPGTHRLVGDGTCIRCDKRATEIAEEHP
jgi:hypothetical protein